MKYTRNSIWMTVGTLVAMLSFGTGALAQIQLDLDTEFSGGAPPTNPTTPWVTATFQTVGNEVLFTLTGTANLTDPENINDFYFNFDDSLDVQSLSFANIISRSGSFTDPQVLQQKNFYRADSDGKYDIKLDFAMGMDPGGTSATFGAGDQISYLISYGTGSGVITDADFGYLGQPSGPNGPFYAAAQVQNIGGVDQDSGWIAATVVIPIPEPTTAALSLLGLAALFHASRRQKL